MELEQIPEIVGQTIDTLAMKLEVPAKMLMEVMIKGTMIEGVSAFIILGGGIMLIIALYKTTKWAASQIKKLNDDGKDTTDMDVLAGVAGVALFVAFCSVMYAIFTEGPTVLVKIFAPEYHLLTEIFSNLN